MPSSWGQTKKTASDWDASVHADRCPWGPAIPPTNFCEAPAEKAWGSPCGTSKHCCLVVAWRKWKSLPAKLPVWAAVSTRLSAKDDLLTKGREYPCLTNSRTNWPEVIHSHAGRKTRACHPQGRTLSWANWSYTRSGRSRLGWPMHHALPPKFGW